MGDWTGTEETTGITTMARTLVAKVQYPDGLVIYGKVRQHAGEVFRLVRLRMRTVTEDGIHHLTYNGTLADYQADAGALYVSLAACRCLEEVPAIIHFKGKEDGDE